jgi:transposase
MPTANETLIAHLAWGKSYDAVAQLTGLSKSTIDRRMRNSSFRRKVREARADCCTMTGAEREEAQQKIGV